jgi:ribosomal protein S18 acetylase RimI-like enzyme
MSPALTLREATADDLPAVLALYAQPGMNDSGVIDIDQAKAIFAQFARYPSYRLWVACGAQGEVIGSYALMVMHNLAHMGTPAAVVEDVVVHPQHRSQGIGRQMMEHARTLAREAGCYKLALSSNQQRTRAHAFYESLGFERHGISFVITP